MAREVVVIGGGPAGVAAAIEAARLGAAVTLASEEPIGGRATHASLVPSKVLLHLVAERRIRGARGRATPAEVAALIEQIEHTSALAAQRMARRLEDAGVRVVRGVARFVAPGTVEIVREQQGSERVPFDAAVIAVGSVPVFPPGFFGSASRPDGERILAPRHLRALRDVPQTMLVIGAGATGAELVHAMSALGVVVTWIVDELGILPGFDRELADSLGDVLMERGVKIVQGKRVTRVEVDGARVRATLEGGATYFADRAFVAVGRRADTARLDLAAIEVRADADTGALATDGACRVLGASALFAAGDAAGPPFVASKALAEGWIAGRGAAGRPLAEAARGHATGVEAVYTDPEIAVCGLSPQRARQARVEHEIRTIGFDESVRGLLEGVGTDPHARGVLRLVIDPETGEVRGGSAIGPRAAEVLGPIAVAVQARMRIDELGRTGIGSPTFGEIAVLAART
jgi:dihydrolipoamide dehydrogenase